VDYKTTGETDDNHNLDPISSMVRGLTQEQDSLVAQIEVIIQFFLDLLQVTGGDLAPKKMGMVFDRPMLEHGCLKTDSNRTTTTIDHNDIKVIRTGLRNKRK
jgi:hypothetical protein